MHILGFVFTIVGIVLMYQAFSGRAINWKKFIDRNDGNG